MANVEKAIMVTGCSGFIGTRLITKLSSLDHTVVAMYKQHLPQPMAHVYPVCSDMSSHELIMAPLRGVDTVVHLAWKSPYQGASTKNTDIMESSNIIILKNLLRAMEKAHTQKLIYISALGADKNSPNQFLKEKYLSEFYILNSKIPHKIIIRSSIVYDPDKPDDRFINSILKTMHYPLIYPVPNAKQLLAPVNLSDMIDVIVKCSTIEVKEEVSFIELTSKDPYKTEEIFKFVLDKYIKTSKIQLKGTLAKLVLPLIEKKQNSNVKQPISVTDILSINGTTTSKFTKNNPVLKNLDLNLKGFKESFS